GVRELEVAILGNANPEASPVGEITYTAEFYDYTAKYSDGQAHMHIPADLPAHVAEQCRALALRAYALLDCAGFARVDLFYQANGQKLFINEINTIPGFTPKSMFPKLWEAGGVSYAELIDKLVTLAIERHRERTPAN
ncbi:MAG: D-alanine--D-alanine ligase, partial [Deltaproteobacteria bacterium]